MLLVLLCICWQCTARLFIRHVSKLTAWSGLCAYRAALYMPSAIHMHELFDIHIICMGSGLIIFGTHAECCCKLRKDIG